MSWHSGWKGKEKPTEKEMSSRRGWKKSRRVWWVERTWEREIPPERGSLSLSFSLRIYFAAGSERERCPEVKRGMIYSSIMVKGEEKIQGAAEAEG